MAMRDWAKNIPSIEAEQGDEQSHRPPPEQDPDEQVQADGHQGPEQDAHDAPGEGELADVHGCHRAVGENARACWWSVDGRVGRGVEANRGGLERQRRVGEDGVAVALDGVDGPAGPVLGLAQGLGNVSGVVPHDLRD